MEPVRIERIKLFALRPLVFVLSFFALRLLSYLLQDHIILESILVFFLLFIFAGIYFRNQILAWHILVAELLLGGTGGLLHFGAASLRSCLLMAFLFLWIVHMVYIAFHKRGGIHLPRWLVITLAPFLFFLILGFINGIFSGNDLSHIISDAIPYVYFLLVLPAIGVYSREKERRILVEQIMAMLLSSALLSLALFTVFSAEIAVVHDALYTWLRDWEAAKITNMGAGFFRIVFPAHLLLPGIVLLIMSLLMQEKRSTPVLWFFLCCAVLTLTLNLSRAYALAMLFAVPILLYKHDWKRWATVSLTTLLIGAGMFFSLSFAASGNILSGFELLGLRSSSFIQPESEISTLTRLTLLPKIAEQIHSRPLIGHGLGSTITIINPATGLKETTTHYDWGFFEFIAELGFLGFLALVYLLSRILTQTTFHMKTANHPTDLDVGILAALSALIIISIFGAGLSHVFGVLMLVGILSLCVHDMQTRHQIMSFFHHIFAHEKGAHLD